MPAHPGSLHPDVYRVAFEASPTPTLVTDADGVIVLVNREAERLFGWEPGTLVGRSVDGLLPESLRPEHAAQRGRYAVEPTARPMGLHRDLRARHRDGTEFPVEVGLSPVRTSGSLHVVCTIMDLTERSRIREDLSKHAALLEEANLKLKELATTDQLTALWNRRAFLEQLDIELERSIRNARPMSVLLLDVDHFKPYNDEFGHLAGDEVLRSMARVLRKYTRRSDFLARIGGEEFGVLLHATDREGAIRMGERFRLGVETTSWPRRPITMSIGAVTASFSSPVPRPKAPARSQLLAAADRALYYSKEQGRNRVTHVQDLLAVTEDRAGGNQGYSTPA
jgi:diguanylate cyclase (GGDEF)-like protein/PAS domain S-box-containing protein